MTIATDTDDLISTSLWGEVVTIIRNDPGYDHAGYGRDFWMTLTTVNADIQRIAGNNPTRDLGQGRFATHNIFLPDATSIKQGDRIRSSDWSVGKAEFAVEQVLSDEGHVEIRTKLVRSVAGLLNYLLLESGQNLLLENKSGIFLED